MNRFLKNFLKFCVPFVMFLMITAMFLFLKGRQVDKKLGKIATYETLLMGDSQSQRLNGELFNTPSYHFGSPAEHCYFTFHKLRKIFSFEQHSVKQVILTFSIHNFSPLYDRMINSDFPEGKNSVRKHMYFLPVRDLMVEGQLRPWDLSGNMLLKGIYGGPYWGGQRISEYANPDSSIIAQTLNAQFTKGEKENKISLINKKYLLLIDSLCKSENVALYVVSTPYHKDYIGQIEEEYVDYFYKTIDQLKHADHIDYLGEEPDVMWMSDANHLNKTGADLYTKKINGLIHCRKPVDTNIPSKRYNKQRFKNM